MKKQFTLKTLFTFNYLIAIIAFILIIVNFIGYNHCNKGLYHKIYKKAVITNVFGIFLLFFTLISFTLNKTGELHLSDKNSYWLTFINTTILLILLVTFTNSANYFNACKDIKENKDNKSNSSEKYNALVKKNGTLTLNIFSLFGVFIMILLSYIFPS